MKTNLLKSWLMLVMLLVGVGTTWATDVTKTISDVVSENSYTVSAGSTINTKCTSIDLDANINVSVAVKNGATGNTGTFWGTSPNIDWRLYQGDEPTITVSAGDGYTITSVKFTYSNSNTGVINTSGYGQSIKSTYQITSGTAYDVNAASATYYVGNTSAKSNGQARITAIEVVYSSTSGGGTTNYDVTIDNNIANGTVTASPTSAAAGATVTLTPTPSTGYEFGSWNVTNASTSTAITVTNNKFTMPAANVNVSATFNVESPHKDFIFNTDAGLSALGITKPAASNGTNLGTSNYTSGAITMTATDGGTATRVWNSNGTTSLRVYAGNATKAAGTLTFSGATITKIVFTGTVPMSANVGSFSDNTWTGEATSVTFTATNSVTISTIAVSYESNGKTTPTLSFANPTYNATIGENFTAPALNNPQNVTVSYSSSETSVATVNATTGVVSLVTSGTTTITASFAGDKDYNPASASYQLEVAAAPFTTMDAIFAAATTAGSTATDCRITFNNWVVSGVKGSNAYVTDNGGKGLIVYTSGHGFEVGDILSGTVACKVQLYKGSSELTALTSSTEGLTVTKGGVVTPVTSVALASLSGVNTGAVLSYENLEYDGTNFTDGVTSLKPYNTFITLPTLVSGKNYNVTGVYVQFDATKEIAPRIAEDFELNEVVNNYVVTFDVTENGTITVKDGETVINEGDEVAEGTTLTIECTPANADYRFQNWQYKVEGGSWNTRQTNPQDYAMPSANVQFRANFELIPVYTIAFSVNGNIVQSDNLKEGAEVTAPADPEAINGKVFTGWIETATVVGATPAYVTPSATAAKAVTYYAVFATQSGDGGESQTNEITYNTENIPTSYADAADVTLNGMTFNVTQMYKNGEKMQWRAAGNKAGTGAMYNKTAIDGIQSIAITYTNDDTNKNFTVKVGNSENPTSGTEISATQDGETNTYVYDCSSITPSYFVLTNGTGAGYLSSIVITYGGGSSYSDYTTTVAGPAPKYGELAFVATTGDDNYYATFSCDHDVIFDAEQMIEVQTIFVLDNEMAISKVSDNSLSAVTDKTKDEGWVAGYYVPANTGVLVYSVGNEPAKYYYTEDNASNMLKDIDEDNMLVATTANAIFKAEADGNYYYKLAYGDNTNKTKLGFWWGAEDGSGNFKVKAGGAVLCVPQSVDAKGFSLIGDDEDADAIQAVKAENGDVIYNLAGQRMQKTQKGLNIVNGRKYIVK